MEALRKEMDDLRTQLGVAATNMEKNLDAMLSVLVATHATQQADMVHVQNDMAKLKADLDAYAAQQVQHAANQDKQMNDLRQLMRSLGDAVSRRLERR